MCQVADVHHVYGFCALCIWILACGRDTTADHEVWFACEASQWALGGSRYKCIHFSVCLHCNRLSMNYFYKGFPRLPLSKMFVLISRESASCYCKPGVLWFKTIHYYVQFPCVCLSKLKYCISLSLCGRVHMVSFTQNTMQPKHQWVFTQWNRHIKMRAEIFGFCYFGLVCLDGWICWVCLCGCFFLRLSSIDIQSEKHIFFSPTLFSPTTVRPFQEVVNKEYFFLMGQSEFHASWKVVVILPKGSILLFLSPCPHPENTHGLTKCH